MINEVIPIDNPNGCQWIYIKAIKTADAAKPTIILFLLSFKSFL